MKNLALVCPKFSGLVAGGFTSGVLGRRPSARPEVVVFAFGGGGSNSLIPPRTSEAEREKLVMKVLASISSSSSREMTTSTSSPVVVSRQPSYIGSPLLWIGVGVGLSAICQAVAARVKRYALQQAFKTMMDQATAQNAQFNDSAFVPGSQYPYTAASSPVETTASPMSERQFSSQAIGIDIQATEVEQTPSRKVEGEAETQEPQKKQAFVDVTLDELLQSDRAYSKEPSEASAAETQYKNDEARASSEQTDQSKSAPYLSVEALEKMMEDPTVQKMVYPYLPEEMRNPTTFKWMMQNPLYRQQLQDMLNNMGGNVEWDNRLMESLNNFDLSSPEVKQQFNQIGLTPEEVISKIMENPDVALAFQNPKVQAAILDCSQNPLSIAKYQNDKEVMDVFNKISELFPGVTGHP